MKRIGLILAFLHAVVGVQGQWPQRPWVRLVLKLRGRPPYSGDEYVRRTAEAFFASVMTSEESDVVEAIALQEGCRKSLIAILQRVLPEEAKAPNSLIERGVALQVLQRIADGSVEKALTVPFESRSLYRYLRQEQGGDPVPNTFMLVDKQMRKLVWLPFVQGLVRKPPLSRDAEATRLVSAYQRALIASPHNDEIKALLADADTRLALTNALQYIFENEKKSTVWGYSQEFIDSFLKMFADGSFIDAISQEQGVYEMLDYARAGKTTQRSRSNAASGRVRPPVKRDILIASVTCALTVALCWTNYVPPL